ncbi:peptidoglycan-recognition protein SC2-like [Acanthaster planci]|uniref:Peptidoglycan-recognition protein SC2-like n=1 Tax=Acanthaster planci TaxID=133434 RepID=A0A8B7YYB1_ACAPL|nr:peptidoglycan-recognition protein SC2-like [Acanthaster planci]
MAKLTSGFEIFGLVLFFGMVIFVFGHQCNPLPKTMYAAENRTLQGYTFARRPVRSRVICGRDCSIDKRCKSFNFNDCSKICELNLATRQEHPKVFNATLGSVYFDGDEDTLLYSLADKAYACAGLTLVERCEWGARKPRFPKAMPDTPDHCIVHHTAGHSTGSGQCYAQDTCSAMMRSFQNYDVDTNGWNDIGYNFVIGGDERVYVGRGWNVIGAHAGPSYNHRAIGIAVIGNYKNVLPNSTVLDVLQRLMACGVESGNLSPSYFLRGHRDVRNTTCPGDLLHAKIKTWSHY